MGSEGPLEFRTARLLLRRFRASDLDPYFEMLSDPETEAWLAPIGSRAAAHRNMAMVEGHRVLRRVSMFAVEERDGGAFVGRVGPWWPLGWPGVEIGWTLHPAFRGRGYATEAALAAAKWTFAQEPGLSRLCHLIRVGNTGSEGVARRIGAIRSGDTFSHAPFGDIPILWTSREVVAERSGGFDERN